MTDLQAGKPQAWFRRLTFYSVLSGLCAMVPVPLLDDHLLRRTRRRMVRAAATRHGIELSDIEVATLAGTEGFRSTWGCFLGMILAVTAKVLRRIVRSVLIFLAVKDASDAASRTFHEGYLLEHALPLLAALRSHPTTADASSSLDTVAAIRQAMDETCSDVDTRPIQQLLRRAFRGSIGLMRRAASRLSKERVAEAAEQADRLEELEEEEAVMLSPMVERLSERLFGQRRYLRHLEETLQRHLYPEPPTPSHPTPGGVAPGSD